MLVHLNILYLVGKRELWYPDFLLHLHEKRGKCDYLAARLVNTVAMYVSLILCRYIYLVFLECFNSCIFISTIVLVCRSACFVIHPDISLSGILVELHKVAPDIADDSIKYYTINIQCLIVIVLGLVDIECQIFLLYCKVRDDYCLGIEYIQQILFTAVPCLPSELPEHLQVSESC